MCRIYQMLGKYCSITEWSKSILRFRTGKFLLIWLAFTEEHKFLVDYVVFLTRMAGKFVRQAQPVQLTHCRFWRDETVTKMFNGLAGIEDYIN